MEEKRLARAAAIALFLLLVGGGKADPTHGILVLRKSGGLWTAEVAPRARAQDLQTSRREAAVCGRPVVMGERAFAQSRGGDVYAVDVRSGMELWRRAVRAWCQVPIRQCGSILCVRSGVKPGGSFLGLDPLSGDVSWEIWADDKVVSSFDVTSDGMAYLGRGRWGAGVGDICLVDGLSGKVMRCRAVGSPASGVREIRVGKDRVAFVAEIQGQAILMEMDLALSGEPRRLVDLGPSNSLSVYGVIPIPRVQGAVVGPGRDRWRTEFVTAMPGTHGWTSNDARLRDTIGESLRFSQAEERGWFYDVVTEEECVVRAVDIASSHITWEKRLNARGLHPPNCGRASLWGDRLYVLGYGGGIAALDPQTGAVRETLWAGTDCDGMEEVGWWYSGHVVAFEDMIVVGTRPPCVAEVLERIGTNERTASDRSPD